MSDRSQTRLLLLFGTMILVPAAVLTVMSVRTLVDDERNALADLQLRLPEARAEVERLVLSAVDGASQDTSLIKLRFRYDGNAIVDPPFQLLQLSDRTEAHLATVTTGRSLLNRGDVLGAIAKYEDELREGLSAEETGELQNLLSQAYLAAGRTNDVRRLYHTLMQSPTAFDADGAHLASMAALRMIRSSDRSEARGVVSDWLALFDSGLAPMFPGVREYFRAMKRIGIRTALSDQHDHLLDQLSRRAQFLEEFEKLQPSGSLAEGGSFLCGTYDDGRTGLALITDRDGDRIWDGVVLDVDEIARRVKSRFPGGISIILFDLEALPDIDRRTTLAVRTVAPASHLISWLNVVLYVDSPNPGPFRQRRFLAISGVMMMALMIGSGVWFVYRGTMREMELAQLRSDFVSNVSHELRTPLQSIQMYAETLSMGRYRDQDQHQRYLDTIAQESNRLARMVSNVLDFSRLERGRLEYRLEPIDLSSVVTKTLDELEPGLTASGFALIRSISEGVQVSGDSERIDGAIGNLIGNAVKYSPEGREVAVSVREEGDFCIVEVADRGIGVPEEDRALIFDRFQRAKNVDNVSGAGLGLSLVQDVMTAHSGHVSVSGRAGGGSVFRLAFPKGQP